MQDLEHDVLRMRWQATLALAGVDEAAALPIVDASAVLTDDATLGLSDAEGAPLGWIAADRSLWRRDADATPSNLGDALRAAVAAGIALPAWLVDRTVAPGFVVIGPTEPSGTARLYGTDAEPFDGRADLRLFDALCSAAGWSDARSDRERLDALATTRGARRQWLIHVCGAEVRAVGMRIAPVAERTLRWLRTEPSHEAAIPRAVRDALGVRELRAIWVVREGATLRVLAEWTLAPSS